MDCYIYSHFNNFEDFKGHFELFLNTCDSFMLGFVTAEFYFRLFRFHILKSFSKIVKTDNFVYFM